MKKALVEHILAANSELLGRGHATAAAEYFTRDYVVHLTGKDRRGLRLVQGFVKEVRRAFPDLQVKVDVLTGTGDRIAWQRTLRGTHREDFHGFPATDRKLQWRDLLVSRFEDGLIAEEWAISDLAERLLLARRP